MGDATAASRTTPAGPRRAPTRRRAVGTRDRIIGHLALITEITDPAGMASARLATAVGYPGSSVAFAQLLSGMERDGLITREVRGKRTYRITLTSPLPVSVQVPVSAPVRAVPEPDAMSPLGAGASAAIPAAIDYDDLARRMLVHLVRRLSELDAADLAMLERLLVPPADASPRSGA